MRIQRRGTIAGESSLKVNCSRKGLKKDCFFLFIIEFYREELGGVVFEGVRRKGEGGGFFF